MGIRSVISGRCFDNTGNAKKNSLYRIWDCNKKSKNMQFRLQYARPAQKAKVKIIYKTVAEKKKPKRALKLKMKRNKRKSGKPGQPNKPGKSGKPGQPNKPGKSGKSGKPG